MDYTKKIMYQSNSWYNDGLRKAQVRDMSGAIVSLQQSLQYNRENIAARNLLGLVYYGIGEVSEALVEWIISKNLCPRDNIADYYIKNVQNSANELESLNQAIKKFNQCLLSAERGRSCDHPVETGDRVSSDIFEGVSASGSDLYTDESEYKGKTDSYRSKEIRYNK